MTKNTTISMDYIDRLVFIQEFNRMKDMPWAKPENNPYKQGSASHAAWNEGIDYWEFEKRHYKTGA
jgi:hypothetical protein